MIVSQNGQDLARITFALSPSSLSETRENNFQITKTGAGWFAQNMGPSVVSLSFDGFMLDIEGYLEKHQFLDNWKNFLEAKRTDKMEYQNKYSVRFLCMGREYYGFMRTITIQTTAQRPFLHQYSGMFMCLSDKYIYKPDQLKVSVATGSFKVTTRAATLGNNVYSILVR
jgi:hypothetical protein